MAPTSASSVVPMSTSGLEVKLRELKNQANKHGQALTQKLASSQSGQDLLHIGTSLQSLPPDLHAMLQQLHSVVSSAESSESKYMEQLKDTVQTGMEVRWEQRRISQAMECAQLYKDLQSAELIIKRDAAYRRTNMGLAPNINGAFGGGEDVSASVVTVEHVASLERCAHIALTATQELQVYTKSTSTAMAASMMMPKSSSDPNGGSASSAIPSLRTRLDEDSERAQFLMKLAPRIRRLESDTVISLTHRLEQVLKNLQQLKQQQQQQQQQGSGVESNSMVGMENEAGGSNQSESNEEKQTPVQSLLLVMIGQCMRGLALLSRGKDVENSFARVAIMPLIRSKMYMGRLDEGGPRGECTGLPSLLEELTISIASNFGLVLKIAESIFHVDDSNSMEVDLITEGVWVPIVTALMSDVGIKMAVFSPGIAQILQRNYVTLDSFLSNLAKSLLQLPSSSSSLNGGKEDVSDGETNSGTLNNGIDASTLYYQPTITENTVQRAQVRLYSHPKTDDFSKKWNLPIYYQLRFGECCNRLNNAIEKTTCGGWTAEIAGQEEADDSVPTEYNGVTPPPFSLPLFRELYNILCMFWRSDVVLRPLTNRFLRGSVQLVGRMLAFIRDGLHGKLQFGESTTLTQEGTATTPSTSYPEMSSYRWCDNELDIACVSWELSLLEEALQNNMVSTICGVLQTDPETEIEHSELRRLISDFIAGASQQIQPLIDEGWNDKIVEVLTSKCTAPLAAVKGVAATYRMTNRPPPSQASHFVSTILRPLKDFDQEFAGKTPRKLSSEWKVRIVSTISTRYADAVDELLTTVQRTEAALQSRRVRRAAAGGISDGEKVKLQLFLDYSEFLGNMNDVGIDPSKCEGLARLAQLTEEGRDLAQKG